MKNVKKNSAFSLIELAVVVLIIGILIAGVTQSSRMTKEARLRTARSLTTSSPVHGTSGLLVWFETSLESSFPSTEGLDTIAITTWNDNSAHAAYKNNGTASGPTFRENVFNSGIPSIRFDGTDDYVSFDGTGIVGQSFTIFVVEQRRASGANYFLGGSVAAGASTTTALRVGYTADTTVGFDQQTTTLIASTVAAYTTPIPRIHTFRFSSSSGDTNPGRTHWINGGASGGSGTTCATGGCDDMDTSLTTAMTAFAGAALGRYHSTPVYYNGDIGELIIFNRALKTAERQAIEVYLGNKYGLKIS